MDQLEKPTLPPAYWQDLAARNPLGLDLSERDARDWFDYVWPVYEHRCLEQRTQRWNHKLRIRTWWQRVTRQELARARERAEEVRRRAQVDDLLRGVDLDALEAPAPQDAASIPPLRMVKGGKRAD